MTDDDPYRLHGPMTDPGRFAGAVLGDRPPRPDALVAAVQGVLIHHRFGRTLYGPPPADFAFDIRATQPAARRLRRLAGRAGTDPLAPRPPFERGVGTSRDFALLLTTLFREAGIAARLRCGFADYLAAGRFEDHWLCEYRAEGTGAWRLADAQLDAAHREALGLAHDPADIPRDAFLTGAAAWRAVRAETAPADAFGHGEEARGLWVVYVNLMRDAAALCGAETSAWDGWRDAPPESRELSAEMLRRADDVADALHDAPDRPPAIALPTPPWLPR